jgi:hypothetical protein
MLSYPEPKNRGKYLAYWLAYRNGGSILGGIINLAFNYAGKKTGKLDWRTYIVFVVLRTFFRRQFRESWLTYFQNASDLQSPASYLLQTRSSAEMAPKFSYPSESPAKLK